jgi:hypothetical protein
MDKDLANQIERMFGELNRQSAAGAIPEPGTLSDLLSTFVDESSNSNTVPAKPQVLTCFATAAVEMWLRAVHSFLISASLTQASPIWSAVAGYYSSHYSVRAFAHLMGTFQLYRKRRIAYLAKDAGHLVVRIEKKHSDHREHKFYWKFVSEHPALVKDPFFYAVPDDAPESDGGHRNRANYIDHIDRFPVFVPLDAESLERAVERISTVELSSVPIPRPDHFPDTLSVQFVAYHRIVKFRRFLDETPGVRNRFWKVQRKPQWCPPTMNFSVVDPVFTALYAGKK